MGSGGVRLDGYNRWCRFLAVRHQVDQGQRSTSPIFSEPFASVSGGVQYAEDGGFWGSHKRNAPLSLPQFTIFYKWCLLHVLFCAANT